MSKLVKNINCAINTSNGNRNIGNNIALSTITSRLVLLVVFLYKYSNSKVLVKLVEIQYLY